MDLSQVRTYVTGVLKQWFQNKSILDKFTDDGTLKYNGEKINNFPVFVSDDSPVGNIISFMGNNAPKDYLVCNGTIYNITDYPLLAQHILDEFGSYNYFGGDGTTTFAVPDLRGEFLRGTGTNSHAGQGSGTYVGRHQDATEAPIIQGSYNNFGARYASTNSTGEINSEYKNVDSNNGVAATLRYNSSTSNKVSTTGSTYTSRPTNTSVLYCIKYQITSRDIINYSTEEQRVGTWIDGKPLYQKTITSNMPQVVTDGTAVAKEIDVTDLSIDCMAEIHGMYKTQNNSTIVPLNCSGISAYTGTIIFYNTNKLTLRSNNKNGNNRTAYITIRYTKTTD